MTPLSRHRAPAPNPDSWRRGYLQGRLEPLRSDRTALERRLKALGVERLPRHSRILDFGCGQGRLLRHLEHKGFTRVVGVEPDLVLLQDRGLAGRVVAGRGPGLPFAAGSFDAVIANAVLHHLAGPEELRRALADLARILRPGGWLFYVEPSRTLVRALLTPLLLSPLARLSRYARQKQRMVRAEGETLAAWLELEPSFPTRFLVPAGFAPRTHRRLPLKVLGRARRL